MVRLTFLFTLLIGFSQCQEKGNQQVVDDLDNQTYFPPLSGEWQRIDPEQLNWNTASINGLEGYMEETQTRAIIILHKGRLAVEKYAGKGFLNGPFTENSVWYWASAGKTLTAGLVGIAEQSGYLTIEEPSNKYLGKGWSSLSEDQENEIKIWHHLTMTTGLENRGVDVDCTLPECLIFRTGPGQRWFYHNAPYTILDHVISGATNQDFDRFFNDNLRDPIGMDGYWTYLDYNHVYFSTARSMARYGLLILNGGFWEDRSIINPDFVREMTYPSQDLNQSYGYLWWLNGQSSYRLPGLDFQFNGSLVPGAPQDAFAGIGKNGQIVFVIPSKDLVVIRLGDNPDNSLVPTKFVNDFWDRINLIISD